MERTAFEALCRADGFTELEERDGPAGFAAKPHTHPFAVRGLVISGEFTLIRDGEASSYRPGDTFDMDAHCEHAERFGPHGATYLIGRKLPG